MMAGGRLPWAKLRSFRPKLAAPFQELSCRPFAPKISPIGANARQFMVVLDHRI